MIINGTSNNPLILICHPGRGKGQKKQLEVIIGTHNYNSNKVFNPIFDEHQGQN
jgi:hypothetical protein